jgi:hypothetical protein
MLADGGGGDLKPDVSRDSVSMTLDIAFALNGGVEGIWMSEEATECESGSALAMGAQEVEDSEARRGAFEVARAGSKGFMQERD